MLYYLRVAARRPARGGGRCERGDRVPPRRPQRARRRLRERLSNPWGRPRFLAITTWVYILWSLVPVLLAIRFAFNSGRSRTSLQGWSLRWFWQDPTLSVFHDPTLQAALKHSLVLAAIVMVIATPLGTALALGMRRWTRARRRARPTSCCCCRW